MVLTPSQIGAIRRAILKDLWEDWGKAEDAALRAPTGSRNEARWFERIEYLDAKILELS